MSLLALCLRPWLHCAGIITNITLLLLPVLRRHHFPYPVGAFVLVALALLPLSSLHCCQHCKLASAQEQGSHNTRWCHCQHRALVVANVALALSPLLRGCLCPHCAGVAALGTPTLPPASQTGICPVMMQLQPVVGEVCCRAQCCCPWPRCCTQSRPTVILAFDGLAKAAMAFYWHCAGVLARIALGSLPASSCPCCWCCVGVVAELAFEVRPVPRKHLRLCFARIPLASLPASCCCPCHQRCAGIIAVLRGRFCPCHAGIFIIIAFASPPALRPGICPVTKQLQHALASLSAPRHHCCRRSASIVALVTWAFLPL